MLTASLGPAGDAEAFSSHLVERGLGTSIDGAETVQRGSTCNLFGQSSIYVEVSRGIGPAVLATM
jgi:hypothetical protein